MTQSEGGKGRLPWDRNVQSKKLKDELGAARKGISGSWGRWEAGIGGTEKNSIEPVESGVGLGKACEAV